MMKRLSSLIVLAVIPLLLSLASAFASAGTTIKSVDKGEVVLAGVGQLAAGTVFEVRRGDDLVGFLSAGGDLSAPAAVRLIAGKAAAGDEAIRVERPNARVGLLGGEEAARVRKELAVLCPGRLVELQGAGRQGVQPLGAAAPSRQAAAVGPGNSVKRPTMLDVGSTEQLDPKRLDAVVITSAVGERAVRQFVSGGRTAIVDLGTYAAWSGAKPKDVVSKAELNVEVLASSDATRGLGVGQKFAYCGRLGEQFVCRCLEEVRPGGRVLLGLVPGGAAVAVEHRIGQGWLLAVDLQSPNGEPGYDPGSVLKWVLPGNLLAPSGRRAAKSTARLKHNVRYVRKLSERLEYADYMKLQEAVADRVGGKWVREKVGVDSGGKTIWRFRTGSLDRPGFFFDGAIHAGEWLNPYLLLELIEYLADVPEEDYKTRWVLRNYSIAIIPMLSGSMRQESFAGCDLNRNFDFRWEDYTKGYGWREGRALKLRGTAPFSEPEARVVRDHIWNHAVIGYLTMHMHGLRHGAMFLSPHILADSDQSTFSATTAVVGANLLDRFLWKGPSPLVFKPVANNGGRTAPYSGSWAAYQGLWIVTTELVGGSDHSLQQKELGFEGLLAFMQVVGVDFAAGKRRWLGCPRTGFARPGGCKDATAMIFTRDGKQTIAYRSNRGEGKLRIPLASEGCRLVDPSGKPVPWTAGKDHCVVPVTTTRCFFQCGAADRRGVLDALGRSKFE